MIRSDPEMNHRIYFITFDFFQVLFFPRNTKKKIIINSTKHISLFYFLFFVSFFNGFLVLFFKPIYFMVRFISVSQTLALTVFPSSVGCSFPLILHCFILFEAHNFYLKIYLLTTTTKKINKNQQFHV